MRWIEISFSFLGMFIMRFLCQLQVCNQNFMILLDIFVGVEMVHQGGIDSIHRGDTGAGFDVCCHPSAGHHLAERVE